MEKYKKAVVTITSSTEVPFVLDSDNTVTSAGFIIDVENGVIVTSRKAARSSPSKIKAQFFDGTIMNGKIIYSGKIKDGNY